MSVSESGLSSFNQHEISKIKKFLSITIHSTALRLIDFYYLTGITPIHCQKITRQQSFKIQKKTYKKVLCIVNGEFELPACKQSFNRDELKKSLITCVLERKLKKAKFFHFQIDSRIFSIFQDINSISYLTVKFEHIDAIKPLELKVNELLTKWQKRLNEAILADDFTCLETVEVETMSLLNYLNNYVLWLGRFIIDDIVNALNIKNIDDYSFKKPVPMTPENTVAEVQEVFAIAK